MLRVRVRVRVTGRDSQLEGYVKAPCILGGRGRGHAVTVVSF